MSFVSPAPIFCLSIAVNILTNSAGTAANSNYILFNDSTTSIVDIPGCLFNVVSIRLWGVYFCWDRCHTFKFLKISCIHEIKVELGPDWSAWEAMADAAPGMEKLSLRWKDCNLPAARRDAQRPSISVRYTRVGDTFHYGETHPRTVIHITS
ncbi:hypothetical protein DFH09DRAFT_1085683 [Mycena vulgaris]|nr:hypothetical protein DFH09DRAFT_1085683 [Mycena vulgaris]